MLNPGRVLTRAQLLDRVWDYDFGGSSTVIATYIACLRRKLAALAAFDVAGVTVLRGHLIGQTDSQLRQVLDLYQPST